MNRNLDKFSLNLNLHEILCCAIFQWIDVIFKFRLKINLRFFTKLSIKIWANVRSLNKTDSLRTGSFVLLFVWASKSSHIVDLKLISKKSKQLFDLDWTKTWIYCWENKYFNLIYHSNREERFGRRNVINSTSENRKVNIVKFSFFK